VWESLGSREVSRLSRTDKDWCRLLEVCQIFGTLIADEQQVYDLNYLDDQLVLGIKGTLSVVELKVLRQRLQAGQESKARRGELLKRLPVGYAIDAMGKVALHPDRRVCEAVQLVFAKFRQCWSVRQTFQWFRDHDVELPANPIQGTAAGLEDSFAEFDRRHPAQSLLWRRLCVGTPSGQNRVRRGPA
jgi:DNA invertase Pin-like site-specific DNA recombinase